MTVELKRNIELDDSRLKKVVEELAPIREQLERTTEYQTECLIGDPSNNYGMTHQGIELKQIGNTNMFVVSTFTADYRYNHSDPAFLVRENIYIGSSHTFRLLIDKQYTPEYIECNAWQELLEQLTGNEQYKKHLTWFCVVPEPQYQFISELFLHTDEFEKNKARFLEVVLNKIHPEQVTKKPDRLEIICGEQPVTEGSKKEIVGYTPRILSFSPDFDRPRITNVVNWGIKPEDMFQIRLTLLKAGIRSYRYTYELYASTNAA